MEKDKKNNKMLKVSVVIPTYNRFDNLFNAIDSVINQDYQNIELIISDDGSTGFPHDSIDEYLKKNCSENICNYLVLTHEINQGTVKNANGAYKIADGDIILPLAEDDTFFDNKVVGRIVKEFEKRNCDVLITSRAVYNNHNEYVRTIPNSKEAKILRSYDEKEKQYSRFITHRFFEVCSGSVLYLRKAFIEKWGYFDERYLLLEDMPFFADYMWDNYLNCAFDIVSIKYREGGITSCKNPYLTEDYKTYKYIGQMKHIDEVEWLVRDIIRYEVESFKKENKLGKFGVTLKHPVGAFIYCLYRIHRCLLNT
jgi:glycosyltransferase involved in cell wall biosynthesis